MTLEEMREIALIVALAASAFGSLAIGINFVLVTLDDVAVPKQHTKHRKGGRRERSPSVRRPSVVDHAVSSDRGRNP